MGEPRERITTVQRRELLLDKRCPICGHGFEGPRRRIYCSVNCANRASYARHAERRRADKRAEYQRRTKAPPSA